jgi:hypothetical protein
MNTGAAAERIKRVGIPGTLSPRRRRRRWAAAAVAVAGLVGFEGQRAVLGLQQDLPHAGHVLLSPTTNARTHART